MFPFMYPAMMIARPKAIQARSDRIRGTVGLSTCVLVTFVLVVVSIDVFLGVVDTGKPTSFGFCEVMKKDWERLNIWEELNLS